MDNQDDENLKKLRLLAEKLLNSDPDRMFETMSEMKTVVKASRNLGKIGSEEYFPIIVDLFKALSVQDHRVVAAGCEVLRGLMIWMNPDIVMEKYLQLRNIECMSPASYPEVLKLQLTVLQTSIKATLDKCGEEELEVVTSTTLMLPNEDLGVAKGVVELWKEISKHEKGKSIILRDAAIENFASVIDIQQSSTVRFRGFELLIYIGKQAVVLDELDEKLGFIKSLANLAFEGNDPLEQQNALEVLLCLADDAVGRKRLHTYQTSEKLLRLMQEEGNPMTDFLIPAILKFFGRAGRFELPNKNIIEEIIKIGLKEEYDSALTTVAMESLASIASTSEGRTTLNAHPGFSSCLKQMHRIIEAAPAEYKCRMLDALSYSFGTEDEKEEILPYWFNIVFPLISQLFQLVHQPFPDIRIAALNFFLAISPHSWAQKHYVRSPGVIEFLTTRSGPALDKESLELKYKIVCTLVDSKTVHGILKEDDIAKLRVYKSHGVLFPDPNVSVALKEGS